MSESIPTVPLGDTNLAQTPYKMILDTALIAHSKDKFGKIIRIHEGELVRLRAIENQYVSLAQQAQIIANYE